VRTKKEPIWIEEGEVLAIHDRLLATHGGAPGLRDEGLLQSALARPRQHHAYAVTADLIEMAALYTAGIVRNHPFVDGNKRAGFVVGILFLELNGFDFDAREEDATRAVLDLASGVLDETAFTAWVRANSKRRR
jgi:death-on-curing protein